MPTAVRDFLEQCFDSLDWGGGVWITPPTLNDQNSLIKEINKIYRNKRTIKVYYMVGKLLHSLSESFDSDQAFEVFQISRL